MMKNNSYPEGALNPFEVGDVVMCIEEGFGSLVEGHYYTVRAVNLRHVFAKGFTSGAYWKRFSLVQRGPSEYDEAMAAQDTYAAELVKR